VSSLETSLLSTHVRNNPSGVCLQVSWNWVLVSVHSVVCLVRARATCMACHPWRLSETSHHPSTHPSIHPPTTRQSSRVGLQVFWLFTDLDFKVCSPSATTKIRMSWLPTKCVDVGDLPQTRDTSAI
jgi:hypothetical protein